jgi:endo-1,4-beta-mannosidase
MPSLRPLQTKKLPNWTTETILPDPAQQMEFTRQLELLINQYKSFPSIATWVFTPTYLEGFLRSQIH